MNQVDFQLIISPVIEFENIFFNGWAGPFRTLVIGIFAYVMLVVFLRISGSRTLSKMNAFDFVVTVALGSTLASILLTQDVSLLQGGIALALLISLQFAVTWSSVRWSWIRQIVTAEPILIAHEGTALPKAMRHVRVTHGELNAALREAHLKNIEEAAAVVLETDGTFSIVKRKTDETRLTSLTDVKRI